MCLLLPVAAPLILSFFLGIAFVKRRRSEPFQKLLESCADLYRNAVSRPAAGLAV
ncbi:hypothetical protein LNQ52_12545 [Klebsiella pneumoniae subsp. pneumoniae]|nr:hypothetical protein [Klebsiella pneumoniae subsp. pneumoniae]